jgi:large-conductance mechanosensitive channel
MNTLYYIVLTLIFIAFIVFIIRKFINKSKSNVKHLRDVISRWWDV